MSNKKIYEVFATDEHIFRPLETSMILTNLTLDMTDSEICFFKIDESLYSTHGIVCLETCIFRDRNERLFLKFSKICPQSFSTLGVKTLYEQFFTDALSFTLREGTLLGKVFLFNLNES